MTPQTPQEYRDRAKQAFEEAKKLDESVRAADREHTPEENARIDELVDINRRSLEAAARAERLQKLEEYNQASAGRVTNPLPHQDPGVVNSERKRYSLLKVYEAIADRRPVDGVEAETSQELARRFNKKPMGVIVPLDILGGERRDLTTTTGTGSVGVTTMNQYIEMLRAQTVVVGLGARVLPDMQGAFSIPRQTSATSAQWVTEGGSATKSNLEIDAVPFVPKTLTANTVVSRKFMLQTSLQADSMVREDLGRTIAIEFDRAALAGSGVGAEPEGLIHNSDCHQVSFAAFGATDPTLAKMLEFEKLVSTSNALLGSLGWATTPAGRCKLKQIPALAGSQYSDFLWTNAGEVIGYKALATNQLPANLTESTVSGLSAIVFGNWNDLVLATWGGVEIIEDIYTQATSGAVAYTILLDADIHPRHPESFAYALDLKTT